MEFLPFSPSLELLKELDCSESATLLGVLCVTPLVQMLPCSQWVCPLVAPFEKVAPSALIFHFWEVAEANQNNCCQTIFRSLVSWLSLQVTVAPQVAVVGELHRRLVQQILVVPK